MNLKLDLTKTKVAFPRGSMASMLYINDTERFKHGIVPANERSTLTSNLKQVISNIKNPAGEPVVSHVYTATELFKNRVAKKSPDLFLEADKYYLSGSLHSSSLFENTTKNYHDGNGMLLAYGKKIIPRIIANEDIINLPPTIIHALGLPIQQQYAGKVMDIFDFNWSVAHPIKTEKHAEHFATNKLLQEIDY